MIYSINDAYQTISAASSELQRNSKWTETEEERTYKENIQGSKRELKEQNAIDLLEYKEAILQQLKRDKEKALEELSTGNPPEAADRIKYLQEICRRNVEKGIADMKNIRDKVYYSIGNLVPEHIQYVDPLDSQDEYRKEFFPDLRYDEIFALGKVTSHNAQDYCSGMLSAGYDDSFNQFSGCLKLATLP